MSRAPLLASWVCVVLALGAQSPGGCCAGNDTEAKLAKLVRIFSKPGAFSQIDAIFGEEEPAAEAPSWPRSSCPGGNEGLECRRAEARRSVDCPRGNICRSPIADAVFAKIVKEKGLEDSWEVDSAALIGYHTGKNPDERAREILKNKGINNYCHKARPIKMDDFHQFDWIFGMDEDNIHELNRKKPRGSKATVELLGKYDPKGDIIIRDPYYDNDNAGFYKVYEQCERSIQGFLDKQQS